MKIRTYAESVGFQVIGRITYLGKYGLDYRQYVDEAGNRYLIDTIFGDVRIEPVKRRKNNREENDEKRAS